MLKVSFESRNVSISRNAISFLQRQLDHTFAKSEVVLKVV